MKLFADTVAVVVDHGRFVHVARTLGRDLAKVYYTTPEERDCPLIRECCIGDGFDEIERVTSLWKVKDKVDVAIFPDVGFAAEQQELCSQGIPVWGPGNADRLETDKKFFLDTLAKTNLPVPPHRVIKGLANLRAYLKEQHEEKFIKISKFRGDWETLHWTNYEEMEGTLDGYAVRFGSLKNYVTFYVFDKIDSVIEDGVDTWNVAGQWPETILHAVEAKDKALIGQLMKFKDLPEEVRCVNEAFGPILNRLTDGGALKFSTEVRITEDDQSFFIDPTARFGSPPSQGECLVVKNLPEVIVRGAFGELVEPEFDDEFVVQANVTLDGDRSDWNEFKLEDDVAEALKGGFCCQVNGKLCLTPVTEYHSQEVGYLCATGPTMKAAIEKLRGLKDKLPGGMSCAFTSLAEIIGQINDAEKHGFEFTDQPVPPAEIVLEEQS